jgi:hypothetical protein
MILEPVLLYLVDCVGDLLQIAPDLGSWVGFALTVNNRVEPADL